MKKTCSKCDLPIFSKGLCLPHWRTVWGKPIKKSVRKIAKISDKKKTQDAEYKKICDEIDAEARAGKRWICFFCGKPLGISCDHHHIAGKQGLSDNNTPLYLDRDNIILAHRACHRKYHDTTIEKLLKSPYYERLMEKIHYICKAKYYNMKSKHESHG